MENTQAMSPAYNLSNQILVVLERNDPYHALLREFSQEMNNDRIVDVLSLEYEIAGLCQYPDCDIHKSEPITIYIQDGELPQVFVRDDFPVVPHLLFDRDGKGRQLCYTDLPYAEIRHRLNGRFLIECINEWFVKTARSELHRSDQPLEPLFYDGEDAIIVNPDRGAGHFARFLEIRQGGGLILKQVSEDVAEGRLYVMVKISLPPSAENIIHYAPTTLRELLDRFDTCQLKSQCLGELLEIIKIRHNRTDFVRLFSQSTRSMLSCPCMIFLQIPQKRNEKGTIERSDIRVFLTPGKTFGDILSDFGIERETSYDKKSGRRSVGSKLMPKGINNWGANIGIKLLNLHFAFTSLLASIYNGLDNCGEQPQCVLLGAGALGSQIYANCLRAGFGKWSIVDKDVLYPHNLARHILTLDSVGENKALAMEQYGKTIVEDADVRSIAADALEMKDSAFLKAMKNATVIVDVSTSIAVEKMLALDVNSSARRISAFLNPCGTYFTMLREDTERSITLDLLEMQLYSILSTHDGYEAYFKLPSTVAYAISCRDITSKISQDNVALCAAIASKELKRLSQFQSADITLWAITDDGIQAKRYVADKWQNVTCGEWRIHISKSLLNLMSKKRSERQPNETGGVLIGQYDFFRKILYVADMIFSPNDSIESPISYIRGCKGLPEKIQEISLRTYNYFSYIGEWHSHPGCSTDMSRTDGRLLNTISVINDAQCLPGFMIICGADGFFSVYIREAPTTLSSSFQVSDNME